jgi:tRNA threonylcarbamoyladenosine biosynthesis protein TsaB
LGVAKGLVLSSETTALLGIPTLDALAAAQGPPVDGERLCALLQAGRGRLAVAMYDWHEGGWKPSGEASIATWDDLPVQSARVVGEVDEAGLAALRDAGALEVVQGAASLRRAGYLAELGWARLERGEADDPATLAPIYLHQPEGSAL